MDCLATRGFPRQAQDDIWEYISRAVRRMEIAGTVGSVDWGEGGGVDK